MKRFDTYKTWYKTWFTFSWILFLVLEFLLNTNVVETSSVETVSDSNGTLSAFIYSHRNHHERSKRAPSRELSGALRHTDGFSGAVASSTYLQNISVALVFAAAFCLSSVVLVMCIFCNACDDDKSSDVGGANGYVGEINLADIQVIYNPSSGAARLPYAHSNEAFKGSQEDIIIGNPAALQASSNGQKLSSALGQNSRSDEIKSKEHPRRLRDVYVERGNVTQLGYENRYAVGSRPSPKGNQTDSGRESDVRSSSTVQNSGSVANSNTSRNYFGAGRDYDMNDVTIKNMHVRY